jgi:2-dehydro-3-deoxygluconokinase
MLAQNAANPVTQAESRRMSPAVCTNPWSNSAPAAAPSVGSTPGPAPETCRTQFGAVAIAVGSGKPLELARRLPDTGPSHAVIKLGASGALALVGGEAFRQNPIPVEALETIGAGMLSSPAIWPNSCELAPQPTYGNCRGHRRPRVGGLGRLEGFPRRLELALLNTKEPTSR